MNREGRLEVCKLLIEHGSEINLEDKFGQNPLFYCVREGHQSIVEYLIEQGIDVNKLDKKKKSPYTFAIHGNKIKIAEILVQHGANPNPNQKQTVEKKQKVKKMRLEEDNNKPEVEQKLNKYYLVRIQENGEKQVLTPNDIEEFYKQYPDIAVYLNNPDKLEGINNLNLEE